MHTDDDYYYDDDVEDYLYPGQHRYAEGRLREAISLLTKAIELDPECGSAYKFRGLAYQGQGKLIEAIDDFKKAIKFEPKWPSLYNDRGLAYQMQEKYVEALADFDQAIKLYPKYADAYSNRGLVYQKQGKDAEAIADFNQALKLISKWSLFRSTNEDRTLAGAYSGLITIFNETDILLSQNTLTDDMLSKIKKSDLFAAIKKVIKKLPNEEQILVLKRCLDKSTVLGKRFWKPEGARECSLEKKTLKAICDHLKTLGVSLVAPLSEDQNVYRPTATCTFFGKEWIQKMGEKENKTFEDTKSFDFGL